MTQDAIHKAISLQTQITEAIATKGIHLSAVRTVFKELSEADQVTIAQTLQAIHAPVIAALQTELSALSGDYISTAAAQ
jgi:hypothetical protein